MSQLITRRYSRIALAAAALVLVAAVACKKPAAKTARRRDLRGRARQGLQGPARADHGEDHLHQHARGLDQDQHHARGRRQDRPHLRPGGRPRGPGPAPGRARDGDDPAPAPAGPGRRGRRRGGLRRRPAQQGAHGPADQGERRLRAAAREGPAGVRLGRRPARAGPGRAQPGPARPRRLHHEGALRRGRRLEERRGRRRHQSHDGRIRGAAAS